MEGTVQRRAATALPRRLLHFFGAYHVYTDMCIICSGLQQVLARWLGNIIFYQKESNEGVKVRSFVNIGNSVCARPNKKESRGSFSVVNENDPIDIGKRATKREYSNYYSYCKANIDSFHIQTPWYQSTWSQMSAMSHLHGNAWPLD